MSSSRVPPPGYPSISAAFGGLFAEAGSPRGAFNNAETIMPGAPNFNLLEWHPAYQSCQRYFLDKGQYNPGTQAMADFMNIRLPYQKSPNPVLGSAPPTHPVGPGAYNFPWPGSGPATNAHGQTIPPAESLIPYIRRLVVTGMDYPGIMHGFFGDDWNKGVGALQEVERVNYLFAAKSVDWAHVKQHYDMSPQETVPFLTPIKDPQLAEIERAESQWSQWLAFQDWMVGPRAPNTEYREEAV